MKITHLSVARWYDPFVSIALAVISFLYVLKMNLSATYIVFFVVVCVGIGQTVLELFRSDRGVMSTLLERPNLWQEVLTRWLGVVFGTVLVLFIIWLIPEYSLPKYFQPLSEIKYFYAGLVILVSLPVIYVSNTLLGNKVDGTYELGLFLTNPFKVINLNLKLFRDGLLEWTLRGFFLILNFTTAVALVVPFKNGGLPPIPADLLQAVFLSLKFIFLILLFTIIPGYMFSARLLNTQTRNLDRSAFGWLVTFICYNPLVNITFVAWLNYSFYVQPGITPWVNNTYNLPLLHSLVIIVIIGMELMHLWSEATLGIRSSNLMNRGVVTSGPFKWTKHPVYVSKCIGWFFATMPFIGMGSLANNIQVSLLFLGVCVVYAMRAWAEEKIFLEDVIYQEYAKYIDRHGIFRFINKLLPFMSWEWRFRYWQTKQL